MKINTDLYKFVEDNLPGATRYPIKFYQDFVATFAGRASQKFYMNSYNKKEVTRLNFADFLVIIWPRERFRLREEIFFSDRFPAYEHNF